MTPTEIQILGLYVAIGVFGLGLATVVWRDGQWKGKVGAQVNFMWEFIQEHLVLRADTGTSHSAVTLNQKGLAVVDDLQGCIDFVLAYRPAFRESRDLLTILQDSGIEQFQIVSDRHGLTLAETLATVAVHIESMVQEGKG